MTRDEAFNVRRLFPRALRGCQPSLLLPVSDLTVRLDLQWQRNVYVVHVRSEHGTAYFGTIAKDGRVSLRGLREEWHAPLLGALGKLARGEVKPAMMCDGSRVPWDDRYAHMDYEPAPLPKWEPFSA